MSHSSYIPRLLGEKLKQSALVFPIIALMGPRQSGKTTLVRNVFPRMKYFSLENPDIRSFAIQDPRGFLQSTNHNGMIIDEAQRVPHLFSYIQGIVDEKRKPGQFILTGSQNFLLLENITQSLAGRVSLHTLLPFSYEEIRHLAKEAEYLPILLNGLYPRIYKAHADPSEWYANYISTYLERDVRQIKNITNLTSFHQFLRLCAGRSGQLLNLSSLANDCGVSHNTIKAWISVLEVSYLLFFLQPYEKSFRKRLVKMPKMHITDPGLLCALLGIHTQSQLETHPMRGAIFESFIVSELLKHYLNHGKQPSLFFWRDRTGHEIDCIAVEGSNQIALEIKSGKTINEEYFKELAYWKKLVGDKNCIIALIYGGIERQQRREGVVVPWFDAGSVMDLMLSSKVNKKGLESP